MTMTAEPQIAVPGIDTLAPGDVDAPRSEVASAIVRQASAWRADVIVMTRRPSPAICRLVTGSVPDQVMRKSNCPVLAVHPKPKVTRNASH